jgi:hypothetical protein
MCFRAVANASSSSQTLFLNASINDYFLENNLPIAVTPAEEIYDPRKFVNYPFWKGLIMNLKGGLEVLASDDPSSIWKNFNNFRKIKELNNP